MRQVREEQQVAPTVGGDGLVALVSNIGRGQVAYDFIVNPTFPGPNDNVDIAIRSTHALIDTLAYPMIHLHGEDGFIESLDVQRRQRNAEAGQLTFSQYYAYRIMCRSGFSALHMSERLFSEYLINAAIKIE